jgi:hypothetical protein
VTPTRETSQLKRFCRKLSGRSKSARGITIDLCRWRIEHLRRTQFSCHPQLTLPDHVHQFVVYKRHLRRSERFNPQHGSHHSRDGSMILFNDVVEVLHLPNLNADRAIHILPSALGPSIRQLDPTGRLLARNCPSCCSIRSIWPPSSALLSASAETT